MMKFITEECISNKISEFCRYRSNCSKRIKYLADLLFLDHFYYQELLHLRSTISILDIKLSVLRELLLELGGDEE